VFWRWGFDLYPDKLFYHNNFTERQIRELAYFISRGLGDTLPFRVNCPREVLRVKVESHDMQMVDVTSKLVMALTCPKTFFGVKNVILASNLASWLLN
jgi:hypothetical protein